MADIFRPGQAQRLFGFIMAGGVVMMFVLNWQLAIGTLILLPLMVLITSLVTRRSRVAFRQVQRNLGAMNAVMEENIAGIRVVKAFARAAETTASKRPARPRRFRTPTLSASSMWIRTRTVTTW